MVSEAPDVDQGEPPQLQSQCAALRSRPERARMGGDRAVDSPAKPGSNRRSVNLRQVVNRLMYILGIGCHWRAIPKALARAARCVTTLIAGVGVEAMERIHHLLYVKRRDEASRETSPTDAIIDAQSVESAEKGGAHVDPHGYDAGKKIKSLPCEGEGQEAPRSGGYPRISATCHPRRRRCSRPDGGSWLQGTLFGMCVLPLKLYGDGGYQEPEFHKSVKAALPQVPVEIIGRPDRARGFVVVPRHRLAERTFAWLNRCSRLAACRTEFTTGG
jgi:transposase